MERYGTKEYRQDMSAIHDQVARTGEPVLITKDGKPYVKIVPAAEESVLERLVDEGLVSWPNRRRPVFDPIDLGGRDSTEIISENRR